MSKSKASKRGGGAKAKFVGPAPDFTDWDIANVESHVAGLRKKMIGALNEVVRYGLRDGVYIRFAERQPRNSLTMVASFPGMGLSDGDDNPPEVRFSLTDAFERGLELGIDDLIRVRAGLLDLVGAADDQIQAERQRATARACVAALPGIGVGG